MSSVDTNMIDDFVAVADVNNADAVQALCTTITAKHDVIGMDASMESTQFCTTVTARSLPENDDSRAPVDIVVALDVSGSMTGRKLALCKETLELLLRELGSEDRLGVVTFGNDATVEVPARKLSKANKDAALARIKNLHTSGCTNMSGGIALAATELDAVESPHEVRAVFLLTDGHANRGVADRNGIVELTKACLSSNNAKGPAAIHCFGYGSDHDQDMLSDISSATEGGSYYFVDQDSDVSSAFGDALGGVLSVVAQNTVVKLSVPSEASEHGVSILNVRHDKAVKQADGSYHIQIGDFYAEESRDIIVETSLSQDDNDEMKIPHIEVSISYIDTIQKKMVTDQNVIGSITRPMGAEVSEANSHVVLQCMRIKATEVMQATEVLADGNKFLEAKSSINKVILLFDKEKEVLDKSANQNEMMQATELLSEMNTIADGLNSRTEYQSNTSKFMKSKIRSHAHQRCMASSETTYSAYRSSKKSAMASMFKKSSNK